MSEQRGTGGNRFIPGDADRNVLERAVSRGLLDLQCWADDTGQCVDLGAITVTTRRIPSGRISVKVSGDLVPDTDGERLMALVAVALRACRVENGPSARLIHERDIGRVACMVADVLRKAGYIGQGEIEAARFDVKHAVEEWFTDVSLDDLFAVKGWTTATEETP